MPFREGALVLLMVHSLHAFDDGDGGDGDGGGGDGDGGDGDG